MKEFEQAGTWWLPESPECALAGTLRSSRADGLLLRVLGEFNRAQTTEPRQSIEVVLGNTLEFGQVTLTRCFLAPTNPAPETRPSGPEIAEYHATHCFLGAHLETEASRRFDSITLTFSLMSKWLGTIGFSHEEVGPEEVVTTYSPPRSITLSIQPKNGELPITMSIGFQSELEESDDEAVLRRSCATYFQSPQFWTVAEWNEQVSRPLMRFLTFATGTPCIVTRFYVQLPSESLGFGMSIRRGVEVVFTAGQNDADRRYADRGMLLRYEDVADELEDILNRWMRLCQEIDSVIDLYMLVRYFTGKFPLPQAEFVSLVQAAETYHRRMVPGGERPKQEFRRLRDRVIEALPTDDRKWLSAQLRNANDKSLRQRLSELVDTTEFVERKLVADKEDFVSRVANTRNFYTHYDEGRAKHRFQDSDLWDAADTLELMLTVLLLLELGFGLDDAHVIATKGDFDTSEEADYLW